MEGISFIGPGRLGGALALALDRGGIRVDSLVYRTLASATSIHDAMRRSAPRIVTFDELHEITSRIILITSGDPEIERIAAALAEFVKPGTIVLHTSGSLSSEILSKAKDAGCFTGSMHPLVSVSDAFLGAERFRGVYFCIEGDAAAVDAASSIVGTLGGKPFSIATHFKPLYHAAAVTASGHLVTVIDAAIEMLAACDVAPETAKEILMPLILSTVENLRTQSPAQALTGTFARADVDAFERHLSAMTGNISAGTVDLYLKIAERSLHLAELQGVDTRRAAELRDRISIAKRNRE